MIKRQLSLGEIFAMSQLQIAIILTAALDVAALYAAAIGWLRNLNKEPAEAPASCELGELGSRSKRPY